jgi:hypothetical protein
MSQQKINKYFTNPDVIRPQASLASSFEQVVKSLRLSPEQYVGKKRFFQEGTLFQRSPVPHHCFLGVAGHEKEFDVRIEGRDVRAYDLSGDTVKAKSAYQDFLGLWKDADPDIPILKEAKAEYAKLQ